jgi:hypothetical protein
MPPSFVSFRFFGVRELDRVRRFGVDISMEVIPCSPSPPRKKNRGRKLGSFSEGKRMKISCSSGLPH